MNRLAVYGAGKSAFKQCGMSVVELLISMVISMAVVAGAIEIVVNSKKNFLDQDEVTFIQTNARYALDLIAKDIRMAGYLGCATKESVQIANSIDDDAGGYISLHGLKGYEGGVNLDSFPTDVKADATLGSDAIMIRRANNSGELNVSSHVPESAVIKLWEENKYPEESTLIIADASCRNVGIFSTTGKDGVKQINHNPGSGSGVGNCTKVIKGNFDCSDGCKAVSCGIYSAKNGEYGPGSKVMEFVSRVYFIGDSSMLPGVPALKRRALNVVGAPSTFEEEIAVGVEDLEILYGIDSDGDGSTDQYRQADQMDLDGDTVITDEEWDQVSNVKISLVFRSQNAVLSTAEKRILAGTEYNDKYMRQVVNSTVKIRNRG